MQKNHYKKENLTSLTIVANVKSHRAKKSLGQNFLKSTLALNKIIEAGEISEEDTILEIGPGKGVLTEKLLEYAGKVIAVEKDQDLLQILQEKFASQINSGSLVLINEDILEFNVSEMENKFLKSPRKKSPDYSKNFFPICYKIIANIPYNITGAIFKKFLTEENQPELMVLMVQHEVAKRIVANDKKESILSISVKAYGEPKIIMKVPARYFSPAPKVDSAVIAVRNISRKIFNTTPPNLPLLGEERMLDEKKFWQIIHAGFAHKRKVLIKNLESINIRQDLVRIFKELNLSEKVRAEDLTLKDWVEIAKKL